MNLAFYWVYRCKAAAEGSKFEFSFRKIPYFSVLQGFLFRCVKVDSASVIQIFIERMPLHIALSRKERHK